MLADQGILAKLEGRHIVLYKSDPAGRGREYQLKGRVETEAGDPIVGANVLVEGTTNGMVTNSKGEFALNVTAGARLSVSFIGYDAAQVEVGNRTHLTVVLKENNQLLDDVVVIGYGVQKKVNLTGSVAVRQMSEIENQPMTHASQALYSMPGVYINQASAKPGSDGATIRIRGVNTLSSANPLVLLDGVEYDINEINPADIESISVLKDASATAIYGARGANGVILVTTRRGDKGSPEISWNSSFGLTQSLRNLTGVDSYNYARIYSDIEMSDNPSLTADKLNFSPYVIERFRKGDDPIMFPSVDWNKYIFKNLAWQTQHSATISGGGDRIRYFVSGGFHAQKDVRELRPEL